jgi:hypothetical protein
LGSGASRQYRYRRLLITAINLLEAPMRSVCTVLLSLLFAATAHAELTVFAGIEYFNWREDTSPSVKETGPLLAGGLSWIQDKDKGILFGYRGQVYFGQVNYDGADLFTGQPVSTNVNYFGLLNEGQLRYRFGAGADRHVDAVLAAGADFWRRQFSDSDQAEDWAVIYARLGAELGPSAGKPGFMAALGLKYPVYTHENANLTDIGFDQNPTLTPGKDWSAYANIGYRFNRHWGVMGYYDSYRFQQSSNVQATRNGTQYFVFQPKSSMDVAGVQVLYSF